MSNKIAIRDAYGAALKELGAVNDKVVVLEADLGSSTKSALFGKAFPERYFNIGIAELNMVSMAAGFASCGNIPFVNTFAAFMVTRGADPIGSVISYDRLNVKLCGTYCGFSDSYDGASHHAITDIAYLRSLPDMTIVSVCDATETKKAVNAVAEYDGPVYLRLSRAAAPVIFDDGYDFRIGKGVVLREGSDVTLVATGYMVHKALEAAELLAAKGVSAAVIDIHTIKPIDTGLLLEYAGKTGCVVTAEEHSIYGGLGSAVAEVLVQNHPLPMEIVGVEHTAESGDYEKLLKKYGLSGEHIAEKALKAISRK
ncbi:MAG: transketolase family protein [Oscillospiraceae bacterium]